MVMHVTKMLVIPLQVFVKCIQCQMATQGMYVLPPRVFVRCTWNSQACVWKTTRLLGTWTKEDCVLDEELRLKKTPLGMC